MFKFYWANWQVIHKEIIIILTTDFSSATVDALMEKSNIFKVVRENLCPKILYPAASKQKEDILCK
jgi:hypothetical protein